MMLVLACFDIEDDKIRRKVGNKLGEYGNRVQKSVFEVVFKHNNEASSVFEELDAIVEDGDDIRFYPLCERCIHKAMGSIEKPGDASSPIIV
ncbi:CRISPR-associated endonuclease Cas2 [Vibrio sp. FJH11]